MKKTCLVFITLLLATVCCQPVPPTPIPPTVPPLPTAAPTTIPLTATPAPPLPSALRLTGGDPITMDPAMVNDSESMRYLVEVFSGLVTTDRSLKVVPDIAERWDVSDDRTIYTFHLRQGVKFHDGRPVTAADFKYSLERAADPKTKSPSVSTYLGDIVGVNDKLNGKATSVKGIVVLDDNTLQITIDAPKSYFLSKLSYPTAFVVDKNNVERDGAAWTAKPNGTGPYKLKEYVRGKNLLLERNDNYYLTPKPQIAQVNFTIGGSTPWMTLYKEGTLDVIPVSSSDADQVRDPSNPLNKEMVVTSQLNTTYLFFNARKSPFDDVKVRQAFALAIDRQKIIDDVYGKMSLKAKSVLPPEMPGYNDDLPDIAYSPERAKQVLSESRYAGQVLRITWGTLSRGKDVQTMADMLKANLGVEVTINAVDPATFFSTVVRNDNPYNMFDCGFLADYPDPEDFIAPMFRSDGALNMSGYSNPDLDKLIDQAAVEKDANQRLKMYQQAEQKILQDMPVVPFYYTRNLWLVKPYVKGFEFPPIVISKLKYASLGW